MQAKSICICYCTSGAGINPLLHGTPLSLPYLFTSINNGIGVVQKPIVISNPAPQFATSISSLTWNGLQFVNTKDHGRLISAAVQYYTSRGSWGQVAGNSFTYHSYLIVDTITNVVSAIKA